MLRGVSSLAEQRTRQRRGGLTTRARLGAEAMTAPARAGFRARFEREALEYAATHGRTLSPRQLDEATTALMRAHMAKMTESRLAKRAQREQAREQAQTPRPLGDSVELLMADAQRRAASDSARDRAAIQRVAQPVTLCVGCWVELCPDSPFPAAASSTLCAAHLAAYTNQTARDSLDMVKRSSAILLSAEEKGKAQPTKKAAATTPATTRRAPVRQHERSVATSITSSYSSTPLTGNQK